MCLSRPLVLIIEDDPSSAEALGLVLRDWGAEVLHGADPAAIGKAVGGRAPDIDCIITDFHLGAGPDGITLVKGLKQSARRALVLVLSGSFHGHAMDAAAEAGFEVLHKPARADAILAWLERA